MINDSLDGINLVVVTVAEASAARAYERGSTMFSAAQTGDAQEGTVILTDQQGHRWRMEEEALVREDDPTKSLRRLPSHFAYWFGWYVLSRYRSLRPARRVRVAHMPPCGYRPG